MKMLNEVVEALAVLIKRRIQIDQVMDTEVDDEGNPVMTYGQQITLLDGPLKGRTLVLWRHQSWLVLDDEEMAEVAGDLFGISAERLLDIEQCDSTAARSDHAQWVAAIQEVWKTFPGLHPVLVAPSVPALAEAP